MENQITVLGIHDGHGAGAALIRDGKVLAAIQEERLRNIKNYSGTPTQAIAKVYEIAQVDPSETSAIAVGCLLRVVSPIAEEANWRVQAFKKLARVIRSHYSTKLIVYFIHKFREMEELKQVFGQLGIEKKEILFVEHHSSHAACAYYQRPWDDETLILTLDGAGDGISATVSVGNGLNIERIASTTFYDSPGNNLYSEVTGYMGLKRWEHEYKVMGMAPYGRPEYCIDQMRQIIRVNPRKPLEFQNLLGAYSTEVQKKLRKLLAEQRFDNISAACQVHFEEILVEWVKNAIKATGLGKIACAGGMFLNVKANRKVRELPEVDDVFFYPASGDSGTPIGAGLEVYFRLCEKDRIQPSRYEVGDYYLGQEFSDNQIEEAIENSEFKDHSERVSDIEDTIADLLVQGKIIARFHGRDEWGPRALGNRSIMADPRDLKVIRKINFAIKMRDFWMPFAASILEEDIDTYLVDGRPARYMIEAFDTTERGDEIIAGTHPFDGTARPQTVNDWNPGWRKIIEKFKGKTGVGGILNTSFNLHGYPIVGSPDVAISTFENSELDGLAIGDWLISRRN